MTAAIAFISRYRTRLLLGAAALVVANVIWVAVTYLVYPGYLDHGEPSVTLISWLLLDGAPAFPEIGAPILTGNVYGPLTYVVHALSFLLFGPTIMAGKAASFLAVVLIPVLIFLSHRPRGIEAAAVGTILGAGLVLFHIPYSIWNRPDAFITLLGVVAVWLTNASDPKRPEWTKSIAIALAAGVAVSMKFHAGAYFAPVVIFHCMHQRRGFKTFAAMAVVGLGVVLLPFAFSVFSLSNFITWISALLGKDHPIAYASKFARYGIIYAMPTLFFAAAWRWSGKRIEIPEKVYFWTFVVSFIVILGPATKVGAGTHYFLPFLAVLVDLILRNAGRLKKHETWVWGLAGILCAGILIVGVPVQKRFFRALHWQEVTAIQSEIRAIMATYPDRTIEMGIGQDLTVYPRTYYRTMLVFGGHPYTVDYAPAMELTMLKVPLPDDLLSLLRGCSTDIWLVPKGEPPFTMPGYYGPPTLDRTFSQTFKVSYAKATSYKFFDVWACKQ
jgi:hypothetical protein